MLEGQSEKRKGKRKGSDIEEKKWNNLVGKLEKSGLPPFPLSFS